MNAILGLIRRQPAACWAVVAAAYALGQALYNVSQKQGIVDPQLVVALVSAVAALAVRAGVTPTARPRAKVNGVLVPLVPDYPVNAKPAPLDPATERVIKPDSHP